MDATDKELIAEFGRRLKEIEDRESDADRVCLLIALLVAHVAAHSLTHFRFFPSQIKSMSLVEEMVREFFDRVSPGQRWHLLFEAAHHAKRLDLDVRARELFRAACKCQPHEPSIWLERVKIEEECGNMTRCLVCFFFIFFFFLPSLHLRYLTCTVHTCSVT